ncbi:RNA polymerase factor sigma-54 [bacterium]|nr:RNA polymerase factor sigma-54 [bacterium]
MAYLKLEQKQQLKQTQKLKMTLEMRQSILILQKQILELRDYLIEEQEKNPYLDIDDWGGESEQKTEASKSGDTVSLVAPTPSTNNSKETPQSDEKAPFSDSLAEFDWDTYRSNAGGNMGETHVRKQNDYDSSFRFENITPATESLSQQLETQVISMQMDENVKDILLFMIYNLDSRGFLRETNEEISLMLEASEEFVAEAREHIKRLEPLGVGSLNLVSYLRFMFFENKTLSVEPDCAERIATLLSSSELLDHLSQKNYQHILDVLEIDNATFRQMISVLQTISPYPAFGYDEAKPEAVIPDMQVHLLNGHIIIQLEDKLLPSVVLNDDSFTKDLERVHSKGEKQFIKEQYRAAEWIVKSLSERNKTLHQVASSLFNFQKAFLEFGEEYLKPLTLKEIAEDIGRHVSTVSRLTKGKYAVTTHGVYELKALFVKQINENMATTNKNLETVIVEIISLEDHSHPLSDDDIASELTRRGIEIARRTVAKYRSKLKILSARERKRDYQFVGEQ